MPETPLQSLAERSGREPWRGFRCWDRDEVGIVMHREAAAASQALMLATHQPPNVRRVTVDEAGRLGNDEVVDEEEVLRTIVEDRDEALIVPIVGASGSGKSHLVLWLRAHLEGAELRSVDRKIVYLKKGDTSLSHVIEELLGDYSGPRFDELRDSVARARRAMSEEEAAVRFRDELAVAVGAIDAGSAGAACEQQRAFLKQHLPALLRDPAYDVRLVGPDGALRRLVDAMLEGGHERPVELTPSDLPVDLTDDEVRAMSEPAREIAGYLLGQELHEVALVMLNEVRDVSLGRIFGVEPLQLVGVLRELREQLFEENPRRELVLMVEDFSLLQGIQKELLEAMIELPRREGRQVMCAMKTVMAVTDGFFAAMLRNNDTLRTRIAARGHVFSLDVQYEAAGTGALDRDALVQFAGRYLNAARVGTAELDAREPQAPNACAACSHRSRCHDAFGTAEDTGHGLYPFNADALDRMVRSRDAPFIPRDVLAMLERTLTVHAGSIADGTFPSSAWERGFDPRTQARRELPTLPLAVEERIDQTEKAQQRKVLLTFWGGAPQTVGNVAAGIHEAFAIPRVEDVPVVDPAVRPEPSRTDASPPVDTADRIDRLFQGWRDEQQDLGSDTARTIRRVFYNAIVAALDGEGRLYSPQLVRDLFPDAENVVLAAAAGGRRRRADRSGELVVRFEQTNEDAMLLAGVVRAERQGGWSFPGGHTALVAFLGRVEAEVARLRALLEERLERERSDRDATVAVLALSGLAAGLGDATSDAGLLDAALGLAPVPSEQLPARWSAIVRLGAPRRTTAQAFVLRAAHVTRGRGGEAVAVDGGQFLPALRALRTGWEIPGLSERVSEPVSRLGELLSSALGPALDEAHDALARWLDEIAELVGEPELVGEQRRAAVVALRLAATEGFGPPSGELIDAGVQGVRGTVTHVGDVLRRWPHLTRGQRVVAIAKAPWDRLDPMRGHLAALHAALERSIEATARDSAGQGGADPLERLEAALDAFAGDARLGAGDADG